MTQEILQIVVTGLITLLTSGGIGVFLFHKQSKKLKDAEVRAAEINNESATNEEWKKICDSKTEEIEKLNAKLIEKDTIIREKDEKIDELNRSKENAWEETSKCKIQCAKKDRIISEINWYRCEVNGCPHRKPPRKFGTFDYPKDEPVDNTIENNITVNVEK